MEVVTRSVIIENEEFVFEVLDVPSTLVIDEYYEKHGTYRGIVEYLNDIEKQERKTH